MGVIVIVIAIVIVIVIVIIIVISIVEKAEAEAEAEAEAGRRDVAQVNLQPEIRRRNRNGKRRGNTVVNQKKRNGNVNPIVVVMTMIRVSVVART